jgi:hypothetical protein
MERLIQENKCTSFPTHPENVEKALETISSLRYAQWFGLEAVVWCCWKTRVVVVLKAEGLLGSLGWPPRWPFSMQ